MWVPYFIPLYSPLNLYLIILWILEFKYIYYYYYYSQKTQYAVFDNHGMTNGMILLV